MKMEDREMKKRFVFVFVLIAFAIVLVGCGSSTPAAPTPHPGQALVETKCSTCHGLPQVNNAKYTRATWESTVDRMVMAGMQIPDDQKALIIDYLAIRDENK